MPRIPYVLAALLALSLTSCVETANVVAFANSVTVVTAATVTMIASDRATCTDINATVSEAEALPKIGAIGSANCTGLDTTLDAIAGVNTVLANYGKALGEASQGSFVSYDSDVSTLQSILKSLPKPPSQDQISAVSGLAGWIATLVTEKARDKTIKAAMVGNNGEMKQNFHQVVGLLGQLVSQYAEGQAIAASITGRIFSLVKSDYGASEPVAVQEMSIRLAEHTHVGSAQLSAIAQYKTALDAMDKAFDAADEQPTAKELLTEVRDFATQARTVYQSFTKAFPNR